MSLTSSSTTTSRSASKAVSTISDDFFDDTCVDVEEKKEVEITTTTPVISSTRSAETATTMFDYFEAHSENDLCNVTDKTATLNDVMDGIKQLNLVDEFGQHHQSIVQLAFEDKETRSDVSMMRKAENIHESAEATELFQFFYDESSGTSVVRCLPCFQFHCISKAHLKSMTPLKAQQKLNTSGKGTLGTGVFLSKETSSLLIPGHNGKWHKKKNDWIQHFTLIGVGSIAMEE